MSDSEDEPFMSDVEPKAKVIMRKLFNHHCLTSGDIHDLNVELKRRVDDIKSSVSKLGKELDRTYETTMNGDKIDGHLMGMSALLELIWEQLDTLDTGTYRQEQVIFEA